VEEYLQAYPELQQDGVWLFELIASEYDLRRRRQTAPCLKEYQQRFPQYDAELRAYIQRTAGSDSPPRTHYLRSGKRPIVPGAAGNLRLGKFELLEVAGRGTFGVVYRARDTELERVVAVKIPRAETLFAAEDMDRFLREARSAAQLRHPG